MKLVSWNVNGLRACITKGFYDFAKEVDADVISLQETKMYEGQAPVEVEGYSQNWNSADKKGYSGTLVLSRVPLTGATIDMGIDVHDHEGRIVTAEFEDFYLVNVYTPNSKNELERLDYRMEWEDAFRDYVLRLDDIKPVIICGDLNVAHEEIDLKNPKTNRRNAGFTDEERNKLSTLLASGFVDSFRQIHPDEPHHYSWWSYRANARKNNTGWRIDYFLVSKKIAAQIKDAYILPEVLGSDHCPVVLEIF